MKNIKYLIVLIITLTLSQLAFAECNNQETSGGEILGTLAGAALGGLIGSQFGGGTGNKVAIGAGVVAGGFLGNKIGKSMSCQDQQYHQETTQNALETRPTGSTSTWTNPDTGHSGTITPTRTSFEGSGQPCREFTHEVYVGGNVQGAYGTACRQADGSWKIVQ